MESSWCIGVSPEQGTTHAWIAKDVEDGFPCQRQLHMSLSQIESDDQNSGSCIYSSICWLLKHLNHIHEFMRSKNR